MGLARGDVTERTPGGDIISVASDPAMDSVVGLTKGEAAERGRPVSSVAALLRRTVARPSDLSGGQGLAGVRWAAG